MHGGTDDHATPPRIVTETRCSHEKGHPHIQNYRAREAPRRREDTRDWLADAPVCAALAQHGIVHVGIAEAAHPYLVRRPDLSGTFVMVCTGGEGQIWLEGKWTPMGAGTALVSLHRM